MGLQIGLYPAEAPVNSSLAATSPSALSPPPSTNRASPPQSTSILPGLSPKADTGGGRIAGRAEAVAWGGGGDGSSSSSSSGEQRPPRARRGARAPRSRAAAGPRQHGARAAPARVPAGIDPWVAQRDRLRDEWEARAAAFPEFRAQCGQRAERAALTAGPRLECLVRLLQLAAQAGLIEPELAAA